MATRTSTRVDLQGPLGGDGVGGEVGQAGAGAEDDDPALLHVPIGAARDVGLGDLGHRDRGLHPRLDAGLLEEVLQGEAVHDGAEHAHVVGAGAVHAAAGSSAPRKKLPPPTTMAISTRRDRLGDLAATR